jgi:hypothetical protein
MTADALVSLAALTAFVCLFYGPWQATCTDVARLLIFARRDALFDLAKVGQLDFASPEYKAIRRSMEGMIRYAHELTWTRLVFFGRVTVEHESPLIIAIGSIKDPLTKEKVEALLRDCTTVLIGTMAAKSIFMAPVVTLLLIYWLCSHTANVFWRRASVFWRKNTLVAHLSQMIICGAECAAS